MLGKLKWLGKSSGEPAATDSRRHEVMASKQRALAAMTPVSIPIQEPSRLMALDPSEHARELLVWLQGPGGRTGSISARDLATVHEEMCAANDVEPIRWTAVGRELRRLLDDRPRRYVDVRGRRTRMYRIPPADVVGRLRAVPHTATFGIGERPEPAPSRDRAAA